MKRFILLFLIGILCIAPAAYAEIYTYDETEDIMNGVLLRHIRRYDADGWLNINAVIADLKEPNVKLELLKGADADSLTSMSDLVSGGSANRVMAAANADFFDNTRPAYSQGFSMGIEIKDGKLLQSQIDESMAAAFYDGERLDLSYMTMSMTVTAPNGQTETVRHLNKHTDYYGDLLMYTSDWNNGYSPAPGGEVVEMVVRNDTVTEFRRNMEPVPIPEDGYVLAVSEGVNMFLANNFAVGDRVELTVAATPSLEGIEAAFGGGTLLLKDGQRTEFTHVSYGNQPRTCVGTNADGTVVYIITVDGRQYESVGVTQEELADIALELGCANALNLDGGGSTRLMADTFWAEGGPAVVNLPTENRKVINAVAITTGKRERTSDDETVWAVGAKIRTSVKAALVGDIIPIELKYYDSSGMDADLNLFPADFNVEGIEAQVGDSYATGKYSRAVEITPLSGGDAAITALYPITGREAEGRALVGLYEKPEIIAEVPSETLNVHVMDGISFIGMPQEIELAVGESLWLTPDVSDGTYTAAVNNPTLLSPTVDNSSVASVSGGTLTALAPGYTVLTLSRDGVTSNTLVKVGGPADPAPALPENTVADPARGEVWGGDSFSVFACTGQRNTLYDSLLYSIGLRRLAQSTSYGFLGLYRPDSLPAGIRVPIQANSFSAIDKGFALIISLPSDGRLSSSDWAAMDSALATAQSKNVIILTNTAPSGRTDADVQLFYDYMDMISREMNVFIVQPGLVNGSNMRNRVHLITLADAAGYSSAANSVDTASVLRFTVSGDECKFSFEPLFAN